MRKLFYGATGVIALALLAVVVFPKPRAYAQGLLSIVIGTFGSATPLQGLAIGGSDGTNLRAFKVAADGTQAFAGGLTNNNAAPAATNVGALTGIANAAAPTFIEGDQVLNSLDLHGSQRVLMLNSVGTTVTNAVGAASSTGVITMGAKDGSGNMQIPVILGNDAIASGNGFETLPAIAKAAPAATTAARAEKLQLDTVSGGIYDSPTPTTNNIGFTNLSISATASVSVKASAGNLYGFIANNGQATACFLQCVNSAGAGTLGTAPIISFPLPLSTSASASIISDIPLANFSTGIACGFSTAAGGASACGTASPATIIYK